MFSRIIHLTLFNDYQSQDILQPITILYRLWVLSSLKPTALQGRSVLFLLPSQRGCSISLSHQIIKSNQHISLASSFNNIKQSGGQISMSESAKIKEEYNKCRLGIQNFPIKCKMYISLLIALYDSSILPTIPKSVKKNYENYIKLFGKLTPEEQLYFVRSYIQYVAGCIKGDRTEKVQTVQEIQTTCEVKSSFMGVTYWEKRTFKFDCGSQRVRLSTSKKQDLLELKNYLIRKSKSEKLAVALQAFCPEVADRLQKLSIRFGNAAISHEIYCNLRNCIAEISHKQLEFLLNEDLREDSQDRPIDDEKLHRGLTILTRKNINEYFNVKDKLIEKLHKARGNSQIVFHKNGVKISKSNENRRFYFLEYNFPASVKDLAKIKENVNILHNKNIENIYYCEKLESFTQNVTANYYKICADIKQYEFVMVVQKNQKPHHFQQVMKAATSLFHGISLEFIVISVGLINKNQFSLSIQAIIHNLTTNKKKKVNQIVKLLLNLINQDQSQHSASIVFNQTVLGKNQYGRGIALDDIKSKSYCNFEEAERQCKADMGRQTSKIGNNYSNKSKDSKDSKDSEQEDEQIFYTIINDDELEDNVALQEFMSNLSPRKQPVLISNLKEILSETNVPQSDNSYNYLKRKPFLQPLGNTPHRYIDKHFLALDWKRSQKGGVVCINEAAINEQKRIFKLIIAQLGQNLFKSRGIMNISLPVQIFKKESSLISIGRNVSYAPLLFEKHQQLSALDRMKKLLIFEISMAAMALSAEKPFNPILGQTYQGEINGCPLFMEQISHHPPITYLYFIGRGYKIYGSVAPQVALRLNCAKGINDKYLTVEFDNGDKCEFSLPTMVINGMLFGQRSIYFEGTNYIIDHKNLIITEITFCSKKGMFSFKSKQSPDFLNGEIYEVTSSFMERFLANGRNISPKKDDKSKILSVFSGQWNSALYINEQLVFNYQQKYPLILQNFDVPLLSDSVYRTDVIELIKGDMVRSQQEKDRLEELQRWDKKLRADYSKGKWKNGGSPN